ncbi:Ig-like domain repeat protein, partial [Salmonella enterica]|nr:Ig-like domain repeat protein [Salmonella enterica]
VGAGSDAYRYTTIEKGTLTFGINTWGPWRTPASYTEFDVMLETDPTNAGPDAAVYNTRVSTTDDYDYFLSELVDLRTGSATYGDVLDDQFINGIDGSFDTNVFNSDSLVLPVSLGILKSAGLITGASSKLKYWVESYTAEAGAVDTVGSSSAPMTITVGSPAVSAYGDWGTLLSTDLPGSTLVVHRNDAAYATDKPLGLMLVHHLNTDGLRTQIVSVKATTSTGLAANDRDFRYGYRPTLTATVNPSLATGTVTFMDGSKKLGTATVKSGKATFTAPVLARGTHSLKAVYGGSTVY